MSDTTEERPILHASERGTAASLPQANQQSLRLSPTDGLGLNVIGQDLAPVACVGLRDVAFAFDSSFVKPLVSGAPLSELLQLLPALRLRHANALGQLPPLSVFGHADPVGDDEYNKRLSGRRARAVYGLLTHRVDIWEFLRANPAGGDDWDTLGTLDIMRDFLGADARGSRSQIYDQYMRTLFPAPLDKTDFLGRGQDPRGKADFQGCGKFNPVLIFSQADDAFFAKTANHAARNDANQPNRRVVIYLFPPGAQPRPELWPCPRVSEPTDGCRKRFFSDAADRLKPGAEQREFGKAPGTFACRFYDRVARRSPCERPAKAPIPVRVVPEVFTRRGNVCAFMERIDGEALPDVESLVLGSTRINAVFTAPDGKIYFLPPRDGDPASQGALEETGDVLELETGVTYTDDGVPAAQTLRRQMAALRQCGEQRVAFGQLKGETEDVRLSIYNVVIDDGHCRLIDALGRYLTTVSDKVGAGRGVTAGPDVQGIDQAMDGFVAENSQALGSFETAAFDR